MGTGIPLIGSLTNPRALAGLVMLFGLVSAQGGRGTMAYFTSTAVSASNVFTAGKVDITGSAIASSTGSSLTFTTDGTATSNSNCGLYGNSLTTANIIANQRLTPGVLCVGKLTVNNTSDVTAWLRLRLVRTSGLTGGTATGGGANTITSGANFPANVNGKTITIVSGTGAGQTRTISSGQGTTTLTLGTNWATTPDTSSVYKFSDQLLNDKLVLYLNEVTAAQTCDTTTFNPATAVDTVTPIGTQVLLGTGSVINGKTFATLGLSDTAASTAEADLTSGKYANLIGNDAVNAITAAGASSATLTASTARHFCLGVHFPSTTASGTLQTTADNEAQTGANTYVFHMIAAQASGRP